MRLGRGRCGWWSTPTEPPSGKRKNLALARFFLLRADRLCGEGVVLAARSVATLDIVHGVANDNLQCFSDHVRGHHVIGGFQRLNQP